MDFPMRFSALCVCVRLSLRPTEEKLLCETRANFCGDRACLHPISSLSRAARVGKHESVRAWCYRTIMKVNEFRDSTKNKQNVVCGVCVAIYIYYMNTHILCNLNNLLMSHTLALQAQTRRPFVHTITPFCHTVDLAKFLRHQIPKLVWVHTHILHIYSQ